MESLYILIPFSVALVLAILAVFGWALNQGQFEDLQAEGERILTQDSTSVDADQAREEVAAKE